IETPLMRFGVVKAQAESFDAAGRAVDRELDQVSSTIPDFATDCRAFIFRPIRRAGQRMHETFQLCLPPADRKIEIVRSVARCFRERDYGPEQTPRQRDNLNAPPRERRHLPGDASLPGLPLSSTRIMCIVVLPMFSAA